MAQSPAQSNTPSGSDPAFFPRREFIRDDRIPSTFSILAISGSACIRVYNFLPPLISALRTFLDRDHLVTSFREDAIQNFCEFSLEGKPWASPKSTFTEKLLVDILALLYQNGFVFLSTIDYGREQDDRVAMAFSKPHTSPPTHSSSSSPRPSSTLSRGSSATLNRPLKVPFAISFPNATTLRVISPPLHSTPAILQTVRAAWPRGVVSEKKIRDTVFEFKLKGYKCDLPPPLLIIAYPYTHCLRLRVSGGYICDGFPSPGPRSPQISRLLWLHTSLFHIYSESIPCQRLVDIHWCLTRALP